ncbi:MAG: 50S ribosomal protein L11 methyltransferase [Pseudomonadota bacterium]
MRLIDPATERNFATGEPWGAAARLMQTIIRPKDRVIAIDAGPGILPALAARLGAKRVIAFDPDYANTRMTQHIFQANDLKGEVLHGRVGRPEHSREMARSRALMPGLPAPNHDLSLILEEERISLMILPAEYGEISLMRHLPPKVTRIVLCTSANAAPAVDLMMLTLIGSGFSFDAALSGTGALLFRRIR